MEEIWKDIAGYEGVYKVSNKGRVKHISKQNNQENICKIYKSNSNYLTVYLYKTKHQKHVFVHRLVAQTFIENPLNLPCINHKDENRENNCVENLEWCTHKYNMNYGNVAKKIGASNSKPIIQLDINGNIIKRYPSGMQAQRETGFSNGGIGECARGEINTFRGYIWKFDTDENN